jgi:transcriptional regulator with XRE-family HTH domain
MAFGQYLRRVREEKGATLTEVARKIDVSIAYLSRIERERENPPPDRLLMSIARALGVPADDLFGAARRLPPDLRVHAQQVIAAYRRQSAGGAR